MAEKSRSGMAFSAGKAALVILAAVVVGLILLQVVDTGEGDNGKASPSNDSTTTTTTVTEETTSTTSGGNDVERDQIAVLVLNSTEVLGAATAVSNEIGAAGYRTLTPADTSPAQITTTVFCKEDAAAAVEDLISVIGNGAREGSEPNPAPADYANADCVVVVGSTSANASSTTSGSSNTTTTSR